MQPLQPDSSNSAAPFQELFTMRVIWGALLLSVLMYVFVAVTKTGGAPTGLSLADANPQNSIEMGLTGMAIFMLVLAYAIPNFVLSTLRKTLSPQANRSGLAKSFFVPFIIRLALLESCTIFGLVMAFQRGSVTIMLPLVIFTVIGYILNFPSETKIRSALQGPERI